MKTHVTPNKWILFLWTSAILMLCCGSSFALSNQEILAQIQSRHSDAAGLSADYTRVTNTPAMEGVFQSSAKSSASGALVFTKPAKIRIEQKQPRPETMVSDGQTVWWYIPDENQVHRWSNVDISGDLKPLLDFLGGLGRLEGAYIVKVTPAGTAGEKAHRLDLTKKRTDQGPSEITVWFSPQDYMLSAFRLTSLTGETTDFHLKGVQFNPPLTPLQFQFKIPPGVQVIEESNKK